MYSLYGWKIADFLGKMAEEESRNLTPNHIQPQGKKCVNFVLQF